jgi:nicotinamide mononucleotide transporter
MMNELIAAYRAMTLAELIAVVLGVVYLVLAVKRSRWCWVAGGISSAIVIWLSAHRGLPMQAGLNVYYVIVSVYGYWHWTDAQVPRPAVSVLPLRWHLVDSLAVIGVSVLTAQYLVRETQAAWPYLDSLTTWGSLYTTWLVARVKLENWAYWFVIDAVEAFLFFEQKLYLLGLMTAVTLIVIVFGHRSWWRTWRAQASSAEPMGA